MMDETQEAPRRMARSQDMRLAFEFFILFSRFEYALKKTGGVRFCKEVQVSKGSEAKRATPDWKSFAANIQLAFFEITCEELKLATNYIFENPPKIQTCGAGWEDFKTPFHKKTEGLNWLIEAIKQVRNNLFHGGKYPLQLIDESSRNKVLLEHSMTILRACLNCDNEVKTIFLDGLES